MGFGVSLSWLVCVCARVRAGESARDLTESEAWFLPWPVREPHLEGPLKFSGLAHVWAFAAGGVVITAWSVHHPGQAGAAGEKVLPGVGQLPCAGCRKEAARWQAWPCALRSISWPQGA